MESQSSLDTSGSLQTNPAAETIHEISLNRLNGSLRLVNEAQKIAVYFDAGELVFAVSNQRQHRLFEILLQAEKITKDRLAAIPDFTNDLALKKYLLENDSFDAAEIETFFSKQISDIVRTALEWQTGEWHFSPLVRIKGDARFPVSLPALLVAHARNLPDESINRRLRDDESFRVNLTAQMNFDLSPHESFVLSRFEAARLTVEQIQMLSGLPDRETRRILYSLWLGSLLVRRSWTRAFSEAKIAAIGAARLAPKKVEPPPVILIEPEAKHKTAAANDSIIEPAQETTPPETAPVEKEISLDEYLDRVARATNYYEIFALAVDAPVADIKTNYFALAKRFHPDLFHKEEKATLQKIQSAFTELAHAYDTLKTESSREVYNFRMRKELAEMKAVESQETTAEAIDRRKQSDQAAQQFKQGFDYLTEENYQAALPLLARAVHFEPKNARYHAYFGKVLAADEKMRHKAESALLTAVKLDSTNADYRLMLAEFFIRFNLLKRAEGELKRLLAIHPKHAEAQRLLDSVAKK